MSSIPSIMKAKPARRAHPLLEEIRRNRILFLMLIPAVIFFILFSYIPMAGVYLAFTKFSFKGGLFGSPFVGFANFKYILHDLPRITANTVLYNLAFIAVNNLLQILMAIVLCELPGKFFRRSAQSVMFLPYFVSFVLIGAFVYNIFNYEFGSLNTMLKGLGMKPVNVYGDPYVWKYILVALNAWKGLGVGTIIYSASIMGISDDYYEAARIDGASTWQTTRHITLPHLLPTFILLLLFGISSILRGQFELFYQVIGDNSTLFKATDIIDTYVYRSLVKTFDFGMSSAAGLYQSFFGFLLIIAVNAIVKRIHSDYALF